MCEVEAAAGAVRIIESQMADLMRQMTLEQGLDPRAFVVYAYGGAGGAHAANFARELGCRTVVVPLGDLASTWSALGVMSSDVLHVYEKAQLMAAPFDADALNGVYDELEGRARAQLAEEGFTGDAVEIRRFADMKFNLQIHQVEVPVPAGTLGPAEAEAQVDRFVERYEQVYGAGSAFTGAGVQAGVFRVSARGRVRTPSLVQRPADGRREPATRDVYWDGLGFTPTAVLPRRGARPGRGGSGAGHRRDGRDRRSSCRPATRPGGPLRQLRHHDRARRRDERRDLLGRPPLPLHPAGRAAHLRSPAPCTTRPTRRSTRSPMRCCGTRSGTSTPSTATRS